MDPRVLELAEKQAALCRAFGNPRRLLILWILAKNELPVHEIAAQAGSTLQNVSQHLSRLKRSKIVTSRRDGQTIYYKIAENKYFENCPALLRAPDVLEKQIRD